MSHATQQCLTTVFIEKIEQIGTFVRPHFFEQLENLTVIQLSYHLELALPRQIAQHIGCPFRRKNIQKGERRRQLFVILDHLFEHFTDIRGAGFGQTQREHRFTGHFLAQLVEQLGF